MGVLEVITIVFTGACMLQWLRSLVRKWSVQARDKTEGDVFRYWRGEFLDPQKCEIEWGWEAPIAVGNAVSFKVKFYNNNGNPFPLKTEDNIKVEIRAPSVISNVVPVVDRFYRNEVNAVKVSFTVSKSGTYEVAVSHNSTPILDSPFRKEFLPGPLSPEHTILARTTHASLSVVTMTVEKNQRLMIDARDEYDNKCSTQLSKLELEKKFELSVREAADTSQYPAFTFQVRLGPDQGLVLDLFMYEVGCFCASFTYDGEEIQNGNFDVLVLNSTESDEVQGNVEKKNLNVWFECRLISSDGFPNEDYDQDMPLEGSSRRSRLKSAGDLFAFPGPKRSVHRSQSNSSAQIKFRKVFCYITPKQLIIKEFFLKIIPKRLYTFRVSPSTKVQCADMDPLTGFPTLLINDGLQPRLVLSCSRRNVLVATYISILHSNMGGQASTFEEKVNHFNEQLRRQQNLDSGRSRKQVNLRIDRENLLLSSYHETKNLSSSEWKQNFVISFLNEEGLDWGGLNREWIHLLCKAMFEPKSNVGPSAGSGLFRSMKNDPQALVLPTPASLSGFKLKFYEFAGKIVGKCLLESAIGGEFSRQVSARFARSFLAQVIDLPITYAYFESDDSELFTSKVKYIVENDVEDMELTFAEEVYDCNGKLEKVVDLIPGGSIIPVTNENKRKYLNRVAQYRLSESIKTEVDHFIKGLTSLVPDQLLTVFDENELELVMCGSSNISVEDMKAYSNTTAFNEHTAKWFWAVLSSFSQDDMARLLQFTTGCSLLPPDGFKALDPKFRISTASYTRGGLPTAHTCFNELSIPSYDSYEELQRMLKIAITEGSTGFGLT